MSEGTASKPPYFRFLTALAYHVFIKQGVDVAIMETGMGGSYDATNVIQRPIVCGITSLGFDHMAILGTTLAEIAWHKAGIMKVGTGSLVCDSLSAAEVVIRALLSRLGSLVSRLHKRRMR